MCHAQRIRSQSQSNLCRNFTTGFSKFIAKNGRQAGSHCEVNVVTSVMSISKSAYFLGLVHKSYYYFIKIFNEASCISLSLNWLG